MAQCPGERSVWTLIRHCSVFPSGSSLLRDQTQIFPFHSLPWLLSEVYRLLTEHPGKYLSNSVLHKLTFFGTQLHPLSVPICTGIAMLLLFLSDMLLLKNIYARHYGQVNCIIRSLEWLLPESSACMTSKLRKSKYHDVFICGSWNSCKVRPIIGMIMNGLHIWAVKNCFIQLSIRIIGGSHKFDEIWGTSWVVLPQVCVPLKLKILWSKEVCL